MRPLSALSNLDLRLDLFSFGIGRQKARRMEFEVICFLMDADSPLVYPRVVDELHDQEVFPTCFYALILFCCTSSGRFAIFPGVLLHE